MTDAMRNRFIAGLVPGRLSTLGLPAVGFLFGGTLAAAVAGEISGTLVPVAFLAAGWACWRWAQARRAGRAEQVARLEALGDDRLRQEHADRKAAGGGFGTGGLVVAAVAVWCVFGVGAAALSHARTLAAHKAIVADFANVPQTGDDRFRAAFIEFAGRVAGLDRSRLDDDYAAALGRFQKDTAALAAVYRRVPAKGDRLGQLLGGVSAAATIYGEMPERPDDPGFLESVGYLVRVADGVRRGADRIEAPRKQAVTAFNASFARLQDVIDS